MWYLLLSGMELVFPALAGGFLTTGRPEKPSFVVLRFSFFISDFKQSDCDCLGEIVFILSLGV